MAGLEGLRIIEVLGGQAQTRLAVRKGVAGQPILVSPGELPATLFNTNLTVAGSVHADSLPPHLGGTEKPLLKKLATFGDRRSLEGALKGINLQ